MIRPRRLTNLLLTLAVAAAAVLVWSGRQAPPPSPGLLPGGIEPARIRVLHAGQLVLELARADGNWQLVAPYTRAADPARVRHLLSLTRSAPSQIYAAAEVDLAGAGLAPAEWRLAIDDTLIEFGGRAPLGGTRYLRVGDQVTLLADNWLPLLQAGAGAFADTHVSPFGPHLQAISTPLARIRRDADGWTGAAAATRAATTMAEAWIQGRAMAVRPLRTSAVSLGQIALRDDRGAIQRYAVTQLAEGLALQDPDAGYELVVDAELAEHLLQPPTPTGAD